MSGQGRRFRLLIAMLAALAAATLLGGVAARAQSKNRTLDSGSGARAPRRVTLMQARAWDRCTSTLSA
jgi:hypothetical protein